jgi:isopentenyl phosphate kinase
VVLVHGGGPQLTRMLDSLGIESAFHEGLRVTDEATLEVAEMVFAGGVNKGLVRGLNALGVPAAGISGTDGPTLLVEPVENLGRVGKVVSVETGLIRTLWNGGFVPVLAPLGLGPEGAYNVNADSAAAALAVGLGAGHLFLLTDVDGLLKDGAAVAPSARRSPRTSSERPRRRGDGPQAAGGDGGGTRRGQGKGTERQQEGRSGRGTLRRERRNSRIRRRASMHAVMETYKRLGIAPTSGRGSWLFDDDGNRYLDFIGGIATNSLGHGHPALVGAIRSKPISLSTARTCTRSRSRPRPQHSSPTPRTSTGSFSATRAPRASRPPSSWPASTPTTTTAPASTRS